MKRYRVKALSVGGRGKRIYKTGDIVVASNFHDENAERRVREGFLEFLDEVEDTKHDVSEGGEPGGDIGGGDDSGLGKETKNDLDTDNKKKDLDQNNELTIETFTKKELCERLLLAGVPFDQQAKKEDLFSLYKSSLTE